ncbi:MAG: spore coat associated protein CotJA [Peptococcaceae bacterium]|nr:spore coat associated protein CotJA [Peptococcaceae bacterium]
MELARAYIPYQMYGATYSPREALERGTLFPDLYRPYPY